MATRDRGINFYIPGVLSADIVCKKDYSANAPP